MVTLAGRKALRGPEPQARAGAGAAPLPQCWRRMVNGLVWYGKMPDKTWEVLPPEEPNEPPRSGWLPGRRDRLTVAFAIALASDLASVWLEFVPPLQWALDLATAGALFLVLGRQRLILPALVAEAVPGLAALPAWVLVVGAIALWGTVTPQNAPPRR